jgi:hypothetical protein
MPEVTNLFLCLVHRFPMKELEEAEVCLRQGIQGMYPRATEQQTAGLVDGY